MMKPSCTVLQQIKRPLLLGSLAMLRQVACSYDLTPRLMQMRLLTTDNAAITNPGPDDLSVDAEAFAIRAIVGRQSLEKGDLYYQGRYEYRDVNISSTGNDTLNLHTIAFAVKYVLKSENLVQVVNVEPGIYSNMKSITKEDLGLALRYTARYTHSSQWSSIWGLGSDRQFGAPRVYPIIGGIYKPSDHLRLAISFPKSQLDFHFSKNWNLYSQLQPIGNQWNVNESTEQYSLITTQPQGSVDFVASGYEAILGIETRLSQRFWIGIEAGYLFNRSYELKDEGDLDFTLDLENTAMAGLSLSMRL